MMKWFKSLFSSPVESVSVEQAPDTASVKDVSAPKISDFPRDQYSVYWEILHNESKEHGYKATLRLYSYMGGVVDESVFVNRYKDDLKKQVYAAIPGKMNKYRKGM